MTPEILLFAAVVSASAAVVGVLAGLIGIGGGLILVPVLIILFEHIGIDHDTAVRSALGTSLATVIVTGITAARSHKARGTLDLKVVWAWSPSIIIGALVGAEVATRLDAGVLTAFFAVMTGVLALNMAFGKREWRLGDAPPAALWRLPAGGFVGFLASMMGIGVAALGVPLMTLFNAPVRAAVAAASLLGAIAALPGVLRFILGGWGQAGLPVWSLGYVNLMGFALIVPLTMLTAPLGVRLAHHVSQQALKRLFALFLGINAIRMLVETLN